MLKMTDLADIRTARSGGARWEHLAPQYGYKGGDQLRTAAGRLDKKAGGDGAFPRGVPETVTSVDEGEGRVLESKGSRIRTPEELVEATGLDLTKWDITKSVVNKWEMGARDAEGEIAVEELWQVKLWLSPSQTAAAADLIADLIATIPALPTPERLPNTGLSASSLLVICPHDLHIDRLSDFNEVGDAWSLELAANYATNAVDRLLRLSSGFRPKQVLLVLGNDLLTADATAGGHGAGGTTTKGTHQDVSARWHRAFRAATAVCKQMIEMCARVAPVHVLIVPGNHDTRGAFYLGDVLDALYREHEGVAIENTPAPRHYFNFGETLLGFCHGHNVKHDALPLLMAQEQPIEWCGTSHREWLIGHTHAAGLKEVGGVRIRTMPSLTPPDAWHAEHGYNQVRAMECLVFDEDRGFTGLFSANGRP